MTLATVTFISTTVRISLPATFPPRWELPPLFGWATQPPDAHHAPNGERAFLSAGWAGPRNASGYLTPEADHFPGGIKAVVDYVHSKNLSFGLYTCSGVRHARAWLGASSGCFVGYLVVRSCLLWQLTTCVGGRPGSFGHWQQDADVFAEWGVDWVKQVQYFALHSLA